MSKREELLPQPKRPYEDVGLPSSRRPAYPNLEEAARRQAKERLARIGYAPQFSPVAAAGSARSASTGPSNARGRVRSASFNSANLRDARIRNGLFDVDEDHEHTERRKRGQDALLLMDTARKNVQSRLSEQDRQIAGRKGIVYREDWANKATEIAQRQSDQRVTDQRVTDRPGRIDIGGGGYISEDELNKIAERNVRPVLDEINERSREIHRQQREKRTQEMARKSSRARERNILGMKRRSTTSQESDRTNDEGMGLFNTGFFLALTRQCSPTDGEQRA
jgi:hypothetical protein